MALIKGIIMKLDSVFTIKNHTLYKISDNTTFDTSDLKQIKIIWSTVELSEDSYNEDFLAKLRDELKSMEMTGKYAVLVPVVDKPLDNPEQLEAFVNTYNHTARRVKDCTSVAGFILPDIITSKGFDAGSPAASFMETLAIKHAQYVYFVNSASIQQANLPDNIATI